MVEMDGMGGLECSVRMEKEGREGETKLLGLLLMGQNVDMSSEEPWIVAGEDSCAVSISLSWFLSSAFESTPLVLGARCCCDDFGAPVVSAPGEVLF